MSANTKRLVDWLTANAIQLLILIGMGINFYLMATFVTKPEFDKHSASEAEVHKSLNENLQTLSKAVVRLEFIANTAEDTARQVREHSVRLAAIEERLKNLERQLAK